MVPRVGQSIGPYEILGRLGSGGMGLVFSAWDARLQRDVAIKLLREEYATPSMRTRFLQEARAASALNHPNICTIFDIGEVAGDPFLVMELLKGETLRARISRGGKLPPIEIHRLAGEVLDALVVAHARGVIHRDIKPANIILVDKPGGGFQAKVLDFGLAKVELDEEQSIEHDLTTFGTTVGTVSYMSPEQARGEPVDARSDLFSLGSVLYEGATGELPFQGATSALIFVELLGKNPAPMRQQNPALPRDLDKFIMKLLAKSPADRFSSAKAALEALQAVTLRKSAFEAMTLWAGKGAGAKTRSDPASAGETPPLSPAPDVTPGPRVSEPPAAGRASGDNGTVLRPRRVTDPFAPRPAHSSGSPPPPSPDRSPASSDPGSSLPPGERPSLPPIGSMVVRPLKPDSSRPSPSRKTLPERRVSDTDSNVPHPASQSTQPAGSSSPASVPPASPAKLRDPFGAPASTFPPGELPPAPPAAYRPQSREPERPEISPSAIRLSPETGRIGGHRRRWAWVIGALLIPPAAAAIAWYFNSREQTARGKGPVTIVLAGMQNGTGDSSLGGVLTTALSLAAAQSPHLSVRSAEDYAVALRATGHASGSDVSVDQARAAARDAGAGVLVFGAMRRDGSSYIVSLRLFDVISGNRLAEVSEPAADREQVSQALDRITSDMRSALGEPSESIARSAVPLSKEASSNLEALQAFASGASLQAANKTDEAVLAFRHAVSADSHFTAAYLRLVSLYREQHAELAAAHAAKDAQTASESASPRTQGLAQAVYALDAAGDYSHAIDLLNQSVAAYPGDLQSQDTLALALNLAGRFSDAQAVAERVLQTSHYDREATRQSELALIAEGRAEAVASIEARAQAADAAHPGMDLLADAAIIADSEMLLPPPEAVLPPAIAASLLDAAGHFTEGAARWQTMADTARANPEQVSAASYAYATSAMNRALAGDCASAMPAAQQAQSLPSGPVAVFGAAEAQALCGDLDNARRGLAILNGAYAHHSAVQDYLGPDLSATIAWKIGEAPTALQILEGARRFDAMSLTGYLRGMVEIAAREPQLGIVQFQAILAHRGPSTLFNPEVYPLAQLGLARAYAASGDTTNSSVAYGRFLELWSSSDQGLAAVAEARSHAHL